MRAVQLIDTLNFLFHVFGSCFTEVIGAPLPTKLRYTKWLALVSLPPCLAHPQPVNILAINRAQSCPGKLYPAPAKELSKFDYNLAKPNCA